MSSNFFANIALINRFELGMDTSNTKLSEMIERENVKEIITLNISEKEIKIIPPLGDTILMPGETFIVNSQKKIRQNSNKE